MTVPNLITTIRMILAPIFVIYLLDDQLIPSLIIFVICVISDGLDGMVARVFNQKSRLGTYLDPIADKLLLVAAFIFLSVRGFLPVWLTVTVIARDILIVLGVFVIYINRQDFSIRPSLLSKINTCLQFTTVIAVLSKGSLVFIPEIHLQPLFYATAVLTISSGLHYMHYWFRIMGEGPASKET